MRLQKVIRRIAALGTGVTMMGATLMGAMAAADLGNYPTPFIDGGKFSGVLVIGDKAAAEDVIGVSDIAVSLQFAATKKVGTASGTSVSVTGDAWQVGTSSKKFELSEDLTSGTNREAIANITSLSYIDDGELKSLAAGEVKNSKGTAPYEQRMYFEDASTGYVSYVENDNDITADFLYFVTGKQIARYELEFTTSLESDVDNSAGTATSTGDYLTDFEDTDLVMLGVPFTIVQARRNGGKPGQITLLLMGGAVRDTLQEGDSKTYFINDKEYQVSLDFVSSTQAKFTLNNEATRLLADGETDKMNDGTTVGVSEILYQDYAGGVHSTEFFLGAQKVDFKDTNVNNTVSDSGTLKVDDESINDVAVWVEGSDDSSTYKIDRINVNITADDDFYIGAGEKLSENAELREPDALFTKNWDIEYQGLSSSPTEKIRVKTSGSNQYELEFVDGNGNKAVMPIAYTSSGTNLQLGDNDDDLIVDEHKNISKDDYFILTDTVPEDGERNSFVFRYRGADKVTDDSPVLKFDDIGSGERIEKSYGSVATNETALATIKIGGGNFRVYAGHVSTGADDFAIRVDMNGDATLAASSTVVAINTNYGARIDVANTSAPDTFAINITSPDTDDYDGLTPSHITFNATASAGEVRLEKSLANLYNWKAPDGEENTEYAYTSLGAFAKFDSPTSDPNTLDIDYPKGQRLAQVFITTKGAAVTTSEVAGETEAVTIQKIDVGATKLASEVSNVRAQNAILVGGPCANSAAADVMGNPADCTAGFEAGKGIVQLFEHANGNVAMLIAGYSAADTRNAAQVVANYQDYKDSLKGTKRVVEKKNNVLTVMEAAAPVVPAAEPAADEGAAQ